MLEPRHRWRGILKHREVGSLFRGPITGGSLSRGFTDRHCFPPGRRPVSAASPGGANAGSSPLAAASGCC